MQATLVVLEHFPICFGPLISMQLLQLASIGTLEDGMQGIIAYYYYYLLLLLFIIIIE
jgi:hypothetical protein